MIEKKIPVCVTKEGRKPQDKREDFDLLIILQLDIKAQLSQFSVLSKAFTIRRPSLLHSS